MTSYRLSPSHKNPLPTYTRTTNSTTRPILITSANNSSKRKGNGGNVGEIKRRELNFFFHFIFISFGRGRSEMKEREREMTIKLMMGNSWAMGF